MGKADHIRHPHDVGQRQVSLLFTKHLHRNFRETGTGYGLYSWCFVSISIDNSVGVYSLSQNVAEHSMSSTDDGDDDDDSILP